MSRKKGHFSTKGVPELWDELKKGLRLMMTPTAIAKLDEIAKEYGLSKSELVERIARGCIPLGKMQEPPGEKGSDAEAAAARNEHRPTESENTPTVDRAA